MKKMMYLVMFAVMLFGTIATGYAEQGDWRGGIRTRIQEARQKINQGIERGTLNRHEAGKLNEELNNILYKVDRMKADGQLSQGERDNINNDLNRLDRDIFKEKYDAQVNVQGDWRGGIRARIQESRTKIDQGIERGTLNRHEAGKLNQELSNILYKIDRMKADGQLSQGERDNINNDLNRLDRDIFKEKHDAQVKVSPVQGDWRGGIRSRIQEAKVKIDRGVQRGTINRYEARKLNKELGQIRYKIDRMKADGRLSRDDRERINRNLDRLERNIAREKRDDDRRHG
jgi:septal ring factor EnvC (AmiA/AmiB activator)